MGLTTGCTSTADRAFETKHNCKISTDFHKMAVSLFILNQSTNYCYHLNKVPFDCTAASLSTPHHTSKQVLAAIPIIQEYLSLNARINCFATRLIRGQDNAQNFINGLVKLGCKISNICLGNRNGYNDEYMIAYNICVPSPCITNYSSAEATHVQTQSNWMDATEVNNIRKQFGLYIKQGKSL